MKDKLLPVAVTMLGLIAACDPGPVSSPRIVRSMLEQRRDKVIIQAWDISCGAAALATLLTFNEDDPVTEKEVAAGLLKFTSVAKVQAQLGFSLLDLKHYAESRGFEAAGLGEVTLRDLLEIGPAIIPVVLRGYNHFVVFRGVQGDRVLVADPAWGNRSMLASEFLDIWQSRVAFTVGRPNETAAARPLVARAKDFWASSAVYQEPGVMQAALGPAPDQGVLVASVPPGAPLSLVAAGTGGPSPAGTAAVGQGTSVATAADKPPQSDLQNPPQVAVQNKQAAADDRAMVSPPRVEPTTSAGQPHAAVATADAPHQGRQPDPVAHDNSSATVETPPAAAGSLVEPPHQSRRPQPAAVRNEPAEAVLIDAKKVRQALADTGANHPLAIRVSLLQRGIAKLALGDVSGARCWFEAAAGGGNGAAATAMGKTFDPNFLRRMGAIGVTPDLRAAMAWYQKAAKLGDGEGLTLSNGIETETSRVLASNH